MLSAMRLVSKFSRIFMPPSKKEGHIALHMSVGRYVGRSVCRYVGSP